MLENNKSWNKGFKNVDSLCDRFPHIMQTLPKPYPPSWPFWVERSVEGIARIVLHLRWIEWSGNMKNLCTVFKRQVVTSRPGQSVGGMARARVNKNVAPNSCGNEIESVVFVLNARRLQQPEGFKLLWQPVRSLIRLQRFND